MSVGGCPLRRKRIKRRLLKQQGGLCAYCRKPLRLCRATFDHIVPKSRGGSNAQENLCVACRKCNSTKGSASAHVFLMMRGIAA